jgi:hypothetical protein
MQTLHKRFPRPRRRRGPFEAAPVANAYHHAVFVLRATAELSDEELRRAAVRSGAFDFWQEPGEDVYTLDDGEPA